MKGKLFQNHPHDYREIFKQEIIESNYRTVFYVLTVLLPVSFFMFTMSILIRDHADVIFANGLLAVLSGLLFLAVYGMKLQKKTPSQSASMLIIHFTYGILLFWGMHMMGHNPTKEIFIMDMVLTVFILAFLFMTHYQVLASYYIVSLIYLYIATPYSQGIFNDLPKLMSPILLMLSAFFLSRMLFAQYIERFVMSEKLKESHEGLSTELYETLEKLRMTERHISNDVIRTLVKVLEYYDIYTRGHSENVSACSVKIAQEMHLNQEEIDEILVCGLVHDIGKILIPVDLLNKVTPLTPEEYKVIKKHSEYGCEMLMESQYLAHIAKIVLHHHERWDGKGYPLGLKANEIPIESQILMVADAWDAMISERIYKKAKPVNQARQEMIQLKGKQFSPAVVDALLNIL